MSMILFVLCLNSLLRNLEYRLKGVPMGQTGRRVAVIAYADDVTVSVTKPEEFRIIGDAVRQNERAYGVRLNVRKSKALAIGCWRVTANELGMDFHPAIPILGITFSTTIERTIREYWALLSGKIRAQARQAFGRDLCLAQRVRYVQNYLLAAIWYTAQIIPAPAAYTQKLTTATAWYVWQGETFRVPMSTLQKPTSQGGWGLIDISVKCRTLLLRRMWMQSTKTDTATAAWLTVWGLMGLQANPPDMGRIPNRLAYLQHYALDMAYIAPKRQDETTQHFTRRIYDSLQQMAAAGRDYRDMRIV